MNDASQATVLIFGLSQLNKRDHVNDDTIEHPRTSTYVKCVTYYL